MPAYPFSAHWLELARTNLKIKNIFVSSSPVVKGRLGHSGVRMSEYDWPGLQAFECCPVCGQNAKPPSTQEGSQRCLLFYPITQLVGAQKNNDLSCPLVVNRMICRLVCRACLVTILAGKIPAHVDDDYRDHFGGRLLMEAVQELPAIPIVQRSGNILEDDDQLSGAYMMLYVWKKIGLFKALEVREASRTSEKMTQFERCPVETVNLDEQEQQDFVPGPLPRNREKKCLVCLKVDPSFNICSRCHWAVYCSTACQKKDWKRHKVVDCKPAAT